MLKKKKKKKSEGKNLEKPEDKIPLAENNASQEKDLAEKISQMLSGLIYISETDAEFTIFEGKTTEAITKEEVLAQTGSSNDKTVAEKDFNEFFAPLIEIQDWYGDEEKATAEKYAQLKDLLEKNLKDLKVFKIGKIQLDVYVVGLDGENKLLGIQTKAVET